MSQPSPLTPARQRALALVSAGDLAGARAVLERAVELGKVNLSEDDPDVLRTAYQLGGVLQQADDPAGARRVLEEAYAAGQWRLGDSDALMLQISHDIGVVAEELGNRHEARKAFGRVAELGPGTLGADHWAVARARAYLGQGQLPSVRPEAATGTPGRTAAVSALEEPTTALSPISAPQQPVPRVPSQPTPAQQVPSQATPAQQVPSHPTPAPPDRSALPRAQGQVAPPPAMPVQGEVVHAYPPVHSFPPPASDPRAPAHQPPSHEHSFLLDEPPAYRKNGVGVFAAIAAVLAAVVAVAALVFVLANRSAGTKDDPDVPTLGGPAPTDVRLRDFGTQITVTWADPSDGSVSFMVTMSHPGEQLRPMSTLGPGQTSYEAAGLNPKLNYCFAVVAVYRGNKFSSSPQTCTVRPTAS